VSDVRRPITSGPARSALLLIGVVVVILVLDVLVDGYEVSTAVLIPILLTVAGLLSVDLPRPKP
jgi:hypothetical protein